MDRDATECAVMDLNAPTHGYRRRSSVLTAQVLKAIRETEDEIFEDTLEFDFVALGGGVATGYWAEVIAEALLTKPGKTAAIVSGDPAGLAPYERPALSKGCLNPSSNGMRDFSGNQSVFPFVCQGTGREAHPPQWYETKGIAILFSCQAVYADLDKKYLKVKQLIAKANGDLDFGDTLKIVYGSLLIATGSRARRISEGISVNIARALQRSCFCTRHPDLSGSPLACASADRFGFGSVHYVRDLGDAVKLVRAMSKVEADGQDTCKEPVLLIGGGFISCEVAAAIVTHCPAMQVVIVMPGEELMGRAGFCKEICHFYEKQLARAGVSFAKNYRVTRMWGVQEEGTFATLERPSQGSVLKKTLPRTFGPADPYFTDFRGVVLAQKQTGEEVRLPARFVVAGIGAVPNSELFRNTLLLSADGGIITDFSLRTTHPSGDVFAAGDVACAPVPLAGAGEGNHVATATKSEHVKTARDMGTHAARVMLGDAGNVGPFDPVPHMYSRLLDVSWKFYGFVKGEACVLGMETFHITRMFGTFWLHDGRIVGAFLEEGPASGNDHSATLEQIARERPRVLSMKRLRKCPLDRLLADPFCLVPPPLGVGEFHADTDEVSLEDAFRKHAGTSNKVKNVDMASVMRELGADWDDSELADALAALDPTDSGSVPLEAFVAWWCA